MHYDVVIVGGGPAGLQSALTLGRARRRILLCDAGPPRNAAALHVQNFVTRDGLPPAEFRRVAREQLTAYPSVELREGRVEEILGERSAFRVRLAESTVMARRVLLCTGMVDELPDIENFHELWGTSIFACPYCHAWEVRDRRFAYLAADAESLTFALLLRGWSQDVVALTNAQFTPPPDILARLTAAGIEVHDAPITRLHAAGQRLEAIELADGGRIERDVLVARPRQQQTAVVRRLGLALDARGYVRVDEATRETSVPGIYAAGDLLTHAQSAILAAASGMQAAAAMNHDVALEPAVSGQLA